MRRLLIGNRGVKDIHIFYINMSNPCGRKQIKHSLNRKYEGFLQGTYFSIYVSDLEVLKFALRNYLPFQTCLPFCFFPPTLQYFTFEHLEEGEKRQHD